MVDKRQQQADALRDSLDENIARAEADLKKVLHKSNTGSVKNPKPHSTHSALNKFSQGEKGQALDSFTNKTADKGGLWHLTGVPAVAKAAKHVVYSSRAEDFMAAEGLKERGHAENVADDITEAIDGTDAYNKKTGLEFEGKDELKAMIEHNTKEHSKDINHRALDPEELIKSAQQSITELTGEELSAKQLKAATTGLSDNARKAHESHMDSIAMTNYHTEHATKRMLGRHPEKEGAEILAMTAYLDTHGNGGAARPKNNSKKIVLLANERTEVAALVEQKHAEMREHKKQQQLFVENTFENPDEVKKSLAARSKEDIANNIENMPEDPLLRRALTGLNSREMMSNKIPELVMAAEPQAYGKIKEGLAPEELESNTKSIANMNLHSKAMEADLAYLQEKIADYDCHIAPPGTSEVKGAAYMHAAAKKTAKATAYKDNDRAFDMTQRILDKQEEKLKAKEDAALAIKEAEEEAKRIAQEAEKEAERIALAKSSLHNAHVVEKLENDAQVEALNGTLHDAHVVEMKKDQEHQAKAEKLKGTLHNAHVVANQNRSPEDIENEALYNEFKEMVDSTSTPENKEILAEGVEINADDPHIINIEEQKTSEQQVQQGENDMPEIAVKDFNKAELNAASLQNQGFEVQEIEVDEITVAGGVEEQAPSTEGIVVEEIETINIEAPAEPEIEALSTEGYEVTEINETEIKDIAEAAPIQVQEVEEITMEGGVKQAPSDVQRHYNEKAERATTEGEKQGLSAAEAIEMPETATHPTLDDAETAALTAEQEHGKAEPTIALEKDDSQVR